MALMTKKERQETSPIISNAPQSYKFNAKRPGEFNPKALQEFNQANAKQQRGDVKGAIAHYQKAIRIAPDFYPALNNLGIIFLRQHNFADARTYFEKSLSVNPDDGEAYINFGHLLYEEGRYREAIDEATRQAMAKDERIVVLGVGVDDAKGIFGTTRGAFEQFGSARVFDTPLSEAALTGICVGAAMRGLHPVLVHARNDFLLLTMDQIVNNAAKWRYMSGGKLHVPFTIRAIIGRGWGQAAQHSQSLQAMFAHVPGLQVIMPATPGDAKGLLMTAYSTDSPVLCLEHRWLYETSGPVPEEPYYLPIGTATVVRDGSDVTIVAVSHMVVEALQAAEILAAAGIEAEIVDPRSLRPLDSDLICRSVAKTGRLVIADTMKVSKPISGAFESAATWLSAASSTVRRRNRSSLALVFSSDWAMACAMSSSSGKKREVRSITIGSLWSWWNSRHNSSAESLVTP